jgi:hypothetical protein
MLGLADLVYYVVHVARCAYRRSGGVTSVRGSRDLAAMHLNCRLLYPHGGYTDSRAVTRARGVHRKLWHPILEIREFVQFYMICARRM